MNAIYVTSHFICNHPLLTMTQIPSYRGCLGFRATLISVVRGSQQRYGQSPRAAWPWLATQLLLATQLSAQLATAQLEIPANSEKNQDQGGNHHHSANILTYILSNFAIRLSNYCPSPGYKVNCRHCFFYQTMIRISNYQPQWLHYDVRGILVCLAVATPWKQQHCSLYTMLCVSSFRVAGLQILSCWVWKTNVLVLNSGELV